MKRYVYDESGMRLVWIDDAEPVCGDCLVCDWEGPCFGYDPPHREHRWVIYLDEIDWDVGYAVLADSIVRQWLGTLARLSQTPLDLE